MYQRARAGIGRTFQRMELFAEMTVRDHLLVAERSRVGTGRFWKDVLNLAAPSAAERARAQATLELLQLADVADAPIEALSLGRGRLVEVGRTLMTDPKLLLLDEPSSGLDANETAALAETLRTVQAERGTAVLLVEHDVEFVRSFVTRVFVLDFGTLIATGPTADVLGSDEVRRGLPGDDDVSEPLFEFRSVEAGYGPFRALFGVSFAIAPGSVTALLGANGAGKTTVARVATGLVRPTAGEVRLRGRRVAWPRPEVRGAPG